MKIIAYILFALQAFVLLMAFRAEAIMPIITRLFFLYGISGFIVGIIEIVILFLPAIIGGKFLKWHKRSTLTISKKMLKENPHLEYWTCSKCKSRNYIDKKICPVCGITRQFSDDQKK